MRVYLAGPLGFSEVGMAFHGEKIITAFEALGYEVLDPWQLTPSSEIDPVRLMPYGEPKRVAWEALNPKIGATNAAAIDSCDLVFAVLDGTDVDSGTASEIGYAFARDKPILGYRGDFRLSADNEGSTVNLQVEYFIRKSGGEIFRQIAELPAALEAIFKDSIQKNDPWPVILVWFQLLIFSIMVARFYVGSTRYIDTQPTNLPLGVSTLNVIFISALFGAFYVSALAVGEDEFYPALVAMHVIDAGWFLFGFLAQLILRPVDQPGEIKVASNRGIMLIFFGLSAVTLAVAAILFAGVHCAKIDEQLAKFLFLGALVALSIFDFVWLKEYYFRHANWIAQNTA